MNGYNRTYRTMLLQRIEDRVDELKGQLASGVCAASDKGIADVGGAYLRIVGKLAAFAEVERMSDEIRLELEKD